jgi:outer membrane protein assembly factor BamB
MGQKKLTDLLMIVLVIVLFQGCQNTRIDVEKDYKKNTNITDKQEITETNKTESETKNLIKKPSLFEQIVVFPSNVSKSSEYALVFPHLVEFETRITGGDGRSLMAESISPQKNGISFSRFNHNQGKIVTTIVDPLTGKETFNSYHENTCQTTTKDGKSYILQYKESTNQTSLVDEKGNTVWTNINTFAYKPRYLSENCINLGDYLLLQEFGQNLLVNMTDGKIKCRIPDDLFHAFSGYEKKMTTYGNLIYSSFINTWYNKTDGTAIRSKPMPVFIGQKNPIDNVKPSDELTAFDVSKCKAVKPGLVTECLQTYPEGMAYFASGKPTWKKEWARNPENIAIMDFYHQLACPYVNLSTDLVLVWYGWGRIEALDRRNGDLAWFRDINVYPAKCSGEGNIIKIRYMETMDYNKDIYIARHLRLDARSGKELASWTEENRYDGESHSFSKFNETNGKVIWKITFKENIRESVHINGVIAILTVNNTVDWEQDYLYGIDSNTGKILWKIPYKSTSCH